MRELNGLLELDYQLSHWQFDKIRVYELARELGMTNKETLDLCDALGIGVKSHSSSVVDAQADRVRRKAEREGLTRDEQPEETPEQGKEDRE